MCDSSPMLQVMLQFSDISTFEQCSQLLWHLVMISVSVTIESIKDSQIVVSHKMHF